MRQEFGCALLGLSSVRESAHELRRGQEPGASLRLKAPGPALLNCQRERVAVSNAAGDSRYGHGVCAGRSCDSSLSPQSAASDQACTENCYQQ